MRHATLVLIAALALPAMACESSPTVAPDDGLAARLDASTGPSASGSGLIVFGPVRETIFFNTVTGEARFHSITAGVQGEIAINCVNIVGNTATISGIVTDSNDPTIVGFEALFQVVDGDATGTDDLSSTVLLHEVGVGPDCTVPSEFDLVPVNGNIDVDP